VTLFLLLINAGLFYGARNVPLHAVCIGTKSVLYRHQWTRIFARESLRTGAARSASGPRTCVRTRSLSSPRADAFFHVDEMHLAYNMVSLLWKGINLERAYGSRRFAWMVLVFVALTGIFQVLVAEGLDRFAEFHRPAAECAVGFSGVLFALKVVLSALARPDALERISHLPFLVPVRWAAWAELVIIQLLVPQASWLGHLAGILAGLVFVSGRAQPLFELVDRMPIPDLPVPLHGDPAPRPRARSPPRRPEAMARRAYLRDGVLRRE
jgi:membrane associated rhomboid family serine protease